MKTKPKARSVRAFVRSGENYPSKFLRGLQVLRCIQAMGSKGLTVEWIEQNTPPQWREECVETILLLINQKIIWLFAEYRVINSLPMRTQYTKNLRLVYNGRRNENWRG